MFPSGAHTSQICGCIQDAAVICLEFHISCSDIQPGGKSIDVSGGHCHLHAYSSLSVAVVSHLAALSELGQGDNGCSAPNDHS